MPESTSPEAARINSHPVSSSAARASVLESSIGQTPVTDESESFVAGQYAVRVGIHGQVGRFSAGGERFRRGAQVVCRTARGLEIGTVLNVLASAARPEASDGQILRRMTAEDQLLWNNLQQLAGESHAACQQWLSDSKSPDRLLEVEPLLDGRTLYFHFLNEVSAETDAQIERLVAIFQETVASSAFSQLLEHGCGPGCGTASAQRGCGSSCSSCAVSKSCAVRR